MRTEDAGRVTSQSPWTPTLQANSSTVRPVKLLELGQNEKGRFARVEFEDESSRPLYLLTIADAWHPIFQPLGPQDFWKIREHFGAKNVEIKRPDGSKKQFRHASFVSTTLSPTRKELGTSNFDTEAYADEDGYIAGLKIAREFLELQETKAGLDCLPISRLLEDMVKASSEHEQRARWAFLVVLDQIVARGARCMNFREWIDEMLEEQVEFQRDLLELRAKERDAALERMRLARQAKQQKRARAEVTRATA